MTSDESRIVQAKYASPKFSEMNPVDFVKISKATLLKIHAITGWVIPDAELGKILVDQFQKTLLENYAELNSDEIEYAFRRNTGVEDWGKSMNLSLIDKVLTPYLNERYKISEVERQIAYKKTNKDFNYDTDINWRAMIEEDYQFFLNGKEFIVPKKYYDILQDDGFFEKDYFMKSGKEKEDCVRMLFRLAKEQNLQNLYTKAK